MDAQALKNSILQLAIQGKLVEQREEEGTAQELLEQIEAEKKQLIKEGKIKKQKALPAIKEEEISFDIPESWEWVRLSDLGEIVGGGTPKTGNSEYWDNGNVPWLTPADMRSISEKYVRYGNRFITEEGLKRSSAKLMPKGSIIYSSRAPIGYIKIAENALATNQGFKSIVPYINHVNEYIYYCLISKTNEIVSRASGTTFKEISGKKFGLTTIPLPPLEEQKRIVAKIEELMPYVDQYDSAYSEVEKLNEKFPEDMQKSILQYAIQGKLVEQREEEGTAENLYNQIQEEKKKLIEEGKIKKTKKLPKIKEDEIPFDIPENWKWVRFGEVIQLTSGQDMSPDKYNNASNGIPYITGASNIQDDNIIINRWTEVPKSIALKGDVLLTCKGTVGKVVILDKSKVHIARQIMSIRSIGLNTEFTQYFIKSYVSTLKSKAKSMIPGISRKDVLEALIPLPPFNEQKRIVERIEDLSPHIEQLIK